jgi:hypothetical protein
MADQSVWRTWKPYAVLVAIAVAAIWWWNTQSPMAQLKDGSYDCIGVYVNESGKYEILTGSDGASYQGTATVQGGELVQLSGSSSLTASQLASLTMRKTGDSHFHVTDDPAVKMYNAVACDFAG